MDCTSCPRHQEAKTNCLSGRFEDPEQAQTTRKHLMIVLDQPDGTDDVAGECMRGSKEQWITPLLRKAGLSPAQVYFTNLVKCKATTNITAKHAKSCYPYFEAELELVQPKVILCVGDAAAKHLFTGEERKTNGVGQVFNTDFKTPHPIFIMKTQPLIDKAMKRTWLKNEVLTHLGIIARFLDAEQVQQEPYVTSLTQLLEYAEDAHTIAFDIETDGNPEYAEALDPEVGRPWMLTVTCFYADGHRSWLFDREQYLAGVWDQVGFLFARCDGDLVAQNGKFDLRWLRRHCVGWDEVHLNHDTAYNHHLLNENARPHSLDQLAWRYLPQYAGHKGECNFKTTAASAMNQKTLTNYAVKDTVVTGLCHLAMKPRLEAQGLLPLASMGARFIDILANTEKDGCRIDTDQLNRLRAERGAECLELEGFIHTVAEGQGWLDFNTGSPTQVGEMLTKLRIRVSKDEFNKVETDKDALTTYEHEMREGLQPDALPGSLAFLVYLMKWRKANGARTTLQGIYDRMIERDGCNYIRTHYKTYFPLTGRVSSEDPNLQNTPRAKGPDSIKICFIPYEDQVLVDVDYSQAEYRIAAEMSGDTKMIEMLRERGDFHQVTIDALLELGVELHSDPTEARWQAKQFNFADLYQAGARTIAAHARVPLSRVPVIQAAKRRAFPEFDAFIKGIPKAAKANGNQTTGVFGRIRRVPYARASSSWWRSRAARQLINSPVQGGAADLLAQAIVKCHDTFADDPKFQARLVLTVHDSATWSVNREHAPEFRDLVTQTFESPKMLDGRVLTVPLVADCEIIDGAWGYKADD